VFLFWRSLPGRAKVTFGPLEISENRIFLFILEDVSVVLPGVDLRSDPLFSDSIVISFDFRNSLSAFTVRFEKASLTSLCSSSVIRGLYGFD